MKIAVFGLPEFPLGKKKIPDKRLDALKEALKSPKVTSLQAELVDEQGMKDADGIICLDSKKADIALMDLELIETRLSRGEDAAEKDFLTRIQKELEQEQFVQALSLSDSERAVATTLNLITLKPILLVAQERVNDSEGVIEEMYRAADMISFFTSNKNELRAWGLRTGATAHEAAGCIHSDIQRGFIKAEVFNFKDVEELGDIREAKSRAMRLENKEYVVQDGDIINFRFSV
ncbi:DUF933 domain-containing protein [Candidatus Omnitrophota bacterium]